MVWAPENSELESNHFYGDPEEENYYLEQEQTGFFCTLAELHQIRGNAIYLEKNIHYIENAL